MKKLITISILIVFNINVKAQNAKFGALAIDKSNGFYYGWSFDYTLVGDAETKAIQECKNKGGDCQVVLVWSGSGCAAYRTIAENIGSAYGWGVAKTKNEADAIATKEVLKRSGNKIASNFVWACNSSNSGKFEIVSSDNSPIQKLHKTDNSDSVYDYEGEILNNEPHGFGTLVYEKSGSTYKGNYQKGERNGFGIYTFKSGNRYEGNWRNDKKHGFGKWYESGGHFEGNYINDLMHGQGKWIDSKGNIVFEGEMVNDEPVKK